MKGYPIPPEAKERIKVRPKEDIADYLRMKIAQAQNAVDRLEPLKDRDETPFTKNTIAHWRKVIGALEWAIAGLGLKVNNGQG